MASNDWINIQLGDVCSKIGSGATPRGGASVYLETSEIALIRSQNVYNEGFRREGLVFISEKHAEQLSNVEVQPDDVLLNITGDSVARCCQIDSAVLPARVNQHVSIIRPDPRHLDARFLHYFMISPQMQGMMLSWAGAGGTRKALTKGMIESFQVPSPKDIAEQQAIACILGILDDKIELSWRMNETLEGMARAIFKSWFVDFLPVRARAQRKDAEAQRRKEKQGQNSFASLRLGGSALNPAIADLFPDAFEASELGEIPKGWEVLSVGDACEFAYGKSLKASLRKPGNVPVMGSNGQIGWHDTPLVKGAGIVVGRKGNPGIVTWVNSDFYPIDTTFYIKPRLVWVPLSYLNYALTVLNLPRLSSDSAVPGLNRNIAYMSWLLLPSREVLDVFARHTRLIMDRVYQGEQENRTLAALRDTLLPKLISGELRVPDAERIVGRYV